jgi:hypothetical protein
MRWLVLVLLIGCRPRGEESDTGAPDDTDDTDVADTDTDGDTDFADTDEEPVDTDTGYVGTAARVSVADAADGVIHGEELHDDVGLGVASLGDLTGDGADEWLVESRPDATGALTLDVYTTADAVRLARMQGLPGWESGSRSVGDVDGDGLPDLGIVDSAGVYVLTGMPADGMAAPSVTIALSDSDLFPDVASAGDVDDDGRSDLLLGAPHEVSTGAAYLFAGIAPGPLALSAARAEIRGMFPHQYVGGSVVSFDIDGDGAPDTVVGALNDEWGDLAGAIHVFLGALSATQTTDDADIAVHAWEDGSGISWQLVPAGDVDGDGREDLVAGGRNGTAWLITSPAPGDSSITDAAAATFEQADAREAHTFASPARFVAAPGDLDGDGKADVVVGESLGNDSAGAATLYTGGPTGVFRPRDGTLRFDGLEWDDRLGYAAASADVDGDGIGDLLLGAPRAERDRYKYGAAWLILGSGLSF